MWPCRRGHWGHGAASVPWWPWLHHLPLPFSLNEETFYGPDCLCPQKVTLGCWERRNPCDEEAGLSPHVPFPPQKHQLDSEVTSPGVDIQLIVTNGHPVRTFRRAAILVVAMTKLLKRPAHKDFADSDLGDFLDDLFGMRGWCWGCHPSWGMLLGGSSWTQEPQQPPDHLPPRRACLLPADRGQLCWGTRLPLHPLPVFRHPRHRPEVLRSGVTHPAGGPAPAGTLCWAER